MGLFTCFWSQAQDLESLSAEELKSKQQQKWDAFKKNFTDDPYKHSGSIGFNARYYDAFGIAARQNPLSYGINANYTAVLFNRITLPFSFMYYENRAQGVQPFTKEFWSIKSKVDALKNQARGKITRFGMSPYYKWAKLHLGHRNLNFSPYTLNGVTFFGAGIELNPSKPKIRFAAMQGRLTKATPINLSLTQPNLPAYYRKGWGVKVGYGDDRNFIDLVSFSAQDNPNSIPGFNNDSLLIYPDFNHVLSVIGQKTILNRLVVNFEVANSAYTTDVRSKEVDDANFWHPKFLLKPTNRTTYTKAIRGNITYGLTGLNVGFQYDLIDPGYRTMGAYFFNSNLENYAVNTSWAMLKGKVQNSVSFGFQNNNLDGTEEKRTTRIISSASIAYGVERFNAGLNYSNYTSRLQYILNPTLDSLNSVVVNSDLGLTGNYVLTSNDFSGQNLSGNFNLSRVTDNVENVSLSNNSRMIVVVLAHSYLLKKSNLSFSSAVNYNNNSLQNMKISRYGLGENVSKSFKEGKYTLTGGANYYLNQNGTAGNNRNLQIQLGGSYRRENHSVNINVIHTGNKNLIQKFSELVGTVNYVYNF